MITDKRTYLLNVPGITPITIDGEKMIKFEVRQGPLAKTYFSNKYAECLHEIIWHWEDAFFFIGALICEGIIEQHEDYSLEWKLNKTSLAWLFKKMPFHILIDGEYYSPITGGFWNPVKTLFNIKKGSLKKLLHIKETYTGHYSLDFKKMKTALEKHGYEIPLPQDK